MLSQSHTIIAHLSQPCNLLKLPHNACKLRQVLLETIKVVITVMILHIEWSHRFYT